MKVYLEPSTDSRGIMRVRDALVRYAPKNIEVVNKLQDADLVIVHVWGRNTSIKELLEMVKVSGKAYAMIQYCLRSTMRPSTAAWYDMWEGATLVWSYYDLPKLIEEDGFDKKWREFNFYHAPLGVDSDVFHQKNVGTKDFIIATCSQGYLTEGVKEAYLASQKVRKKMFHLGKQLNKEGMVCMTGISDDDVAWYYSRSAYVSGLRRVEGFEFPVIEGLMCGARPIVFDRPEMRQWFGDLAIFIPEEPREKVVESLTRIFTVSESLYPFVTKQEMEIAKERFDWAKIIKGFWDKVV